MKHKQKKYGNAIHGFTLIETLLAVSVFALVGLIVSTTFWNGMMLSKRVDRRQNFNSEAVFALNLMAAEIENIVRYDFSQSYPELNDFLINDHAIQFILESEDGLKVVRYFCAEADRDQQHTVRIGPTFKKNTGFSIKEEQRPAWQLYRAEKSLVEFFSNQEMSEVEIIAAHINPDGFRISFGGEGSGTTALPQNIENAI
jgi:prepilin-type N-terminal cleavage/methylation domain-containing protein